MTRKRCSKCNKDKELRYFHHDRRDGYKASCKMCRNRQNRMSYKTPVYTEEQKQRRYEAANRFRKKYPEKETAKWKVNYALKRGRLKKMPCITCGDKKSEGHHPDYSKPLEVIWLCRKHHREIHRQGEDL